MAGSSASYAPAGALKWLERGFALHGNSAKLHTLSFYRSEVSAVNPPGYRRYSMNVPNSFSSQRKQIRQGLSAPGATASSGRDNCLPSGRFTKSALTFIAASVLAASAIAQVASGTTGIDASGNQAKEMAACRNGSSNQSRETCMTEARNANAAKRAGKLDGSSNAYKANALMRCNSFKGEDKVACEARVSGMGKPQGSVAGGGVLTQVETVVIPPTPQPVNIEPQTRTDTIILIPAAK